MRTSIPNIIEFVTDPQLLDLSLSSAQETVLRASYALPLTAAQHELWQLCTGRDRYPAHPFSEVTILAGARAGKDSRIAAPIVCYEAVFGGHEHQVAKGERGVIPLVAQDQRATQIAFGYIRDYLTSSPMLKSKVVDVLRAEVTLANGLSISCFPSTLRSLRGWSIPAAVLDELAFFRLEGALVRESVLTRNAPTEHKPFTVRCRTTPVCQARSSDSGCCTRVVPRPSGRPESAHGDPPRGSTCTGTRCSPRGPADDSRTPSSTAGGRSSSPP